MNGRFDVEALQRLDNPGLDFMVRLASVNVFLVLFNLIPAFPMDGGRRRSMSSPSRTAPAACAEC